MITNGQLLQEMASTSTETPAMSDLEVTQTDTTIAFTDGSRHEDSLLTATTGSGTINFLLTKNTKQQGATRQTVIKCLIQDRSNATLNI